MIKNRLYFFLTLLVIAISGNPAVNLLGKETLYIGVLAIFLIYWRHKYVRLIRHDVIILSLFSLIALIHVLSFGTIAFYASIGFINKLSIAMLAVRLIPNFQGYYVALMYALALLSLIFYLPFLFGIDIPQLLAPLQLPINGSPWHIGVHNFRHAKEFRNCGMFWEPGAFAGYLTLALFFLLRDGQAKAVLSKQGVVLIAALLTTQSTTGYLAFFVLIVFYLYKVGRAKGILVKTLVLPGVIAVLVLGVYVAMNEFPFLGEKISEQIESASIGEKTSRINRFGNVLYDLDWIEQRPILGWSANPETRLSFDPEVLDLVVGQGNGLTGFAVKFGLVGLFIFIGFFAYTVRRATGSLSVSLFGIVIVCTLLNGEQFLGFPMFLSLMFAPQRKSKSLPLPAMLIARKPGLVGKRIGYRT